MYEGENTAHFFRLSGKIIDSPSLTPSKVISGGPWGLGQRTSLSVRREHRYGTDLSARRRRKANC